VNGITNSVPDRGRGTIADVDRLVIADAHLGHGHGDLEVMQQLLMRAIDRGVGEVVFLGDVCQYLIGYPKFWTYAVEQMIETWRVARRRGVRVVLIEGNRDFFLDAQPLAREVDLSCRRYDVTAGDRRFRFEHGDLVNRRDLQYRFWSMVSKSGPARMWARMLPRATAVSIVRGMESRLAETNRKFRYVKPVRDLERTARAAWGEGIDVVMWGHFHTPWWMVRDQRLAMVVPAWLEYRTGIWIDAGGAMHWGDAGLTVVDAVSTMKPCPLMNPDP